MDFVAIDVETANADMASICQVGLAVFRDLEVVEEWESFVDPQDYFDPINVSIHGIDESTVNGAPSLPSVATRICEVLSGRIAVCHTHFDRVAVQQAFRRHQLPAPSGRWLDSARVARRAWKECAEEGYGLMDVCELIGYKFRHHNALEDAKAAGQILLAAVARTGLSVDQWMERVERPIDPESALPIARKGNPAGPFYGEIMVFTGALEIPRREAADLASEIGCEVGNGVTKRTTMLVVGDQDIRRLAGHDKSSKQRKAEDLITAGQRLRIMQESDFKELVTVVRSGRLA